MHATGDRPVSLQSYVAVHQRPARKGSDKGSDLPSGIRDQRVRQNKRTTIRNVLIQARRYGWTEDMTVDVMEAQLAPARLMWGVYGPCVYCGTWLASVVDHIHPVSLGGDYEPENLASACVACNTEKGATPLAEWGLGMNYAEWSRRSDMERAMFPDATLEQWMAAWTA